MQAFFRPEGQHLRLLVRVPLKAMRDVEFPQRPSGYLDLDRVSAMLPDAATVWISGALDVYEDDALLPKPAIVASRVSLESDQSFETYDAGAGAYSGTEAYEYDASGLGPGAAGHGSEYPIESDRVAFFDSLPTARLAVRTWSPRCDSCRPAERFGRLNSRAIPAWCGWTRAGFRPPCDS